MSQSQSSLKDASTPARQAGNVHGLVLLAAAVMPIMAITSIIPVLPLLLREFADVPGSAALVPVALTVPALCVALFSPIAGWLSDRIGRKRLLVGSLTIYAGCGFAPWFMESLTAIIASRVALGIVEAAIMTLTTALIDGVRMSVKVDPITDGFRLRYRGADLAVKVRTPRAAELAALMPEKAPPDTSKMLLCPMPGLIVSIAVEVGDEVQEGQALCTVEAMKMENVLRAEKKAVVSKINAGPGDSLAVDEVIMEFE